MHSLWRKITYYRHRSELGALGVAKEVPFLAILPIGAVLGFWWCFAPLPIILPIFLMFQLLGSFGEEIFFAIFSIPTLVVLFFATPWAFRWYWIAAGMMFG